MAADDMAMEIMPFLQEVQRIIAEDLEGDEKVYAEGPDGQDYQVLGVRLGHDFGGGYFLRIETGQKREA